MPSFKWIQLFAIRALLWKRLLEECQVVEDTTDLILILIFYEWIPVVLVGAYFLFFFIVLVPLIFIIGCLEQFTLLQWKKKAMQRA